MKKIIVIILMSVMVVASLFAAVNRIVEYDSANTSIEVLNITESLSIEVLEENLNKIRNGETDKCECNIIYKTDNVKSTIKGILIFINYNSVDTFLIVSNDGSIEGNYLVNRDNLNI